MPPEAPAERPPAERPPAERPPAERPPSPPLRRSKPTVLSVGDVEAFAALFAASAAEAAARDVAAVGRDLDVLRKVRGALDGAVKAGEAAVGAAAAGAMKAAAAKSDWPACRSALDAAKASGARDVSPAALSEIVDAELFDDCDVAFFQDAAGAKGLCDDADALSKRFRAFVRGRCLKSNDTSLSPSDPMLCREMHDRPKGEVKCCSVLTPDDPLYNKHFRTCRAKMAGEECHSTYARTRERAGKMTSPRGRSWV